MPLSNSVLKYFILTSFVIVLIAKSTTALAQESDTVLNRYKYYLLSISENKINYLPHTIKSWPNLVNGQWPDVDYSNREPGIWKTLTHLRRVNDMAVAWAHPKSALFHNNALWDDLYKALSHWVKHKYINPNWWHNEVGVPQLMRNTVILTRGNLDYGVYEGALTVLKQTKLHSDATGANMIWCADLVFHVAALARDVGLMAHCQRLIAEEIKISTGDGIQPDFSFHQHNARLQMYQYGRALFVESVRLAWQLRQTSFALPADKLAILRKFALNGWQWMARYTNTVPGTIDRSVVRINELRSADLRFLLPFLKQLFGDSVALKEFERHQLGKTILTGFRHFPYSDFTAYQQPGFSAFLKTISTRTLATESINNENILGGLLNSGDIYYVRTGNEYYNLMPVWNWDALPGVTTFPQATGIERRPFNGGVGSLTDGLAAMDYVIKDRAGIRKLETRKFWSFHNGLAVSLIAEASRSDNLDTIYTTVDQPRLQGKVSTNNLYEHPMGKRWIYHNKLAYCFKQPVQLQIKAEKVSGSWARIDGAADKKEITDSILLLKIIHIPKQPVNVAYAVGYFTSVKKLQQFNLSKAFSVIANNKDCQAVQFEDRTLMAAFYKATVLQVNNSGYIKVNKPCLLTVSHKKLYISDPTHIGGYYHIIYRRKHLYLQLPGDGTTVCKTI